MRRGCSQARERISILLGDLCMALSITTTSFLCLSTSGVAFPSSTVTLFSFRSYKQASPLCQIFGYISLPETVTAPSYPRMTRCEKHAVLPPPLPLCISHPLPVYCALCSAFSSLNPYPLLPLYAQDEGIDNHLCGSALRPVDHPGRTNDDYPTQTLRHRLA
jgi:hypothetical protein